MSEYGTRRADPGGQQRAAATRPRDRLTATARAFLSECDGFYVASLDATGSPSVQYRGGPPGFLRVLDDHTLGWADFPFTTARDVTADDRVALVVVDARRGRRLRLFGRAQIVDVGDSPGLVAWLADVSCDAAPERATLVTVEAVDWNGPQDIVPRLAIAGPAQRRPGQPPSLSSRRSAAST